MTAYIQQYAPHMRDEVLNIKLREEDRLEVLAASGLNSREAIGQSLDVSQSLWVAKVGSEIVAVFGLSIPIGTVGVPWLLGTDALDNSKVSLMKHSRSILNALMLPSVDYLTNYVSASHTSSIKWLTWLGFTINYNKEIYLKDKSVVFYQFWMHKTKGLPTDV